MSDTSSSSRRTGRRSRSGCITCRIRRVKCDETKPHCTKCTQSGRTCDGYAPPEVSRRALAVAVRGLGVVGPASRVLAGPQTSDEVAGFDFFRLRTAPTAGAFFPSDFWSRVLLQAAHAEPAVWNAAAALGVLHRKWEITTKALSPGGSPASAGPASEDLGAKYASQAAVCYGQALTQARSIQNPTSLLVLSVALAAVSNLAGRWADSRVHVTSGQRLLAQFDSESVSRQASANADVSSAAETLARLDLQSITFSEASAPFPYDDNDLPETGRGETQIRIDGLSHATKLLVNLLSRFLVLAGRQPWGELEATPLHRVAEAQIKEELKAWEMAMLIYLDTIDVTEIKRQELIMLSLKLYHGMLRLGLRAGIIGAESRWDACLAHFERLISLSSTLLLAAQNLVWSALSVDMGMVMPMFFTATRCRHSHVRRIALALLQKARRHEGMWQSMDAATVAEKLIAIEEEGLGIEAPTSAYLSAATAREWATELEDESPQYWLSGDEAWVTRSSWEYMIRVPEEKRVTDVSVTANIDMRRADITLIYTDKDVTGAPRLGHIAVPL